MPTPRPPIFYHLMALITICIWSGSFLFIIELNERLTPLGVVALRFDFFLPVLLLLLIIRRPRLRGLTPREWSLVIATALVGGPLYHTVFAWSAGQTAAGAPRIDTALLGLILATVPVHAGWLGWLCLGERLTARRIGALALGLGGVMAVIVARNGGFHLDFAGGLAGPVAAIGAAIVGAVNVVLLRGARSIYPPADLVAVTGIVMMLVVACYHPFAEFGRVPELDTMGWVAAVFLGVCGIGIAFLTWATALSGLPAVTTATYLFMASVLAALWGYLFRGEAVGWAHAAGAMLVLAGLVIMATERRAVRPGAVAPAPLAPAHVRPAAPR